MPSYHMFTTLKPEGSLKSVCLNKDYCLPKNNKLSLSSVEPWKLCHVSGGKSESGCCFRADL